MARYSTVQYITVQYIQFQWEGGEVARLKCGIYFIYIHIYIYIYEALPLCFPLPVVYSIFGRVMPQDGRQKYVVFRSTVPTILMIIVMLILILVLIVQRWRHRFDRCDVTRYHGSLLFRT